ncbi:hypothetical protein TVAG_188750 [Trichomonas vaginalis G3]|uniref:receptor protein-tyrosine kinase n=1 Tax=Trichomonas vaginalis (strain ATCC PRA-98 / G3) TaxID=412133 RepID=A2EEZ0_TRIV3|nr:glycine-rich protein family [Trichomonas vaginalis G3]EAY08788.1 hypothetical protein TVAG_188750 [Trichomonas vaginalis G3]KAI5515116.1 glycine-rich protein family [Trichomonas vaginalis G3]|eukprot:XP_001321011.1 hypothetical protein [Trichomonas vaginalis G3]
MSSHIDEEGNCTNEAYVAIANGNTKCNKVGSRGGAGGYISGIIKLSKRITAYATIGGRGIYAFSVLYPSFDRNDMIKGGYGGGGYAFNYYDGGDADGAGSGGGQTAVKFLANDLWH